MSTKRNVSRVLVLAAVSGFLATGCYSHQAAVRERVVPAPTGRVVVSEAPPPARPEIIAPAPTVSHVWLKGYWTFQDGQWVWIPGHWEVRPRTGAVWAPGQWDRTSTGWIWTPGHWD